MLLGSTSWPPIRGMRRRQSREKVHGEGEAMAVVAKVVVERMGVMVVVAVGTMRNKRLWS